MVEDTGKEKKVGWNLAEALIQELGDLLKEASYYYVRKEFDRVSIILRAIRMRIVDRLTDTEVQKFVDMENRMYVLSKEKRNTGDFGSPTKESTEASFKFWELLDKYNTRLLRTMRKYGYLIQTKADKTALQI